MDLLLDMGSPMDDGELISTAEALKFDDERGIAQLVNAGFSRFGRTLMPAAPSL